MAEENLSLDYWIYSFYKGKKSLHELLKVIQFKFDEIAAESDCKFESVIGKSELMKHSDMRIFNERAIIMGDDESIKNLRKMDVGLAK